jgi:hypothetical protein
VNRRFRLVLGVWLLAALSLSASAAAFVCHPDAAGTRTLVVPGHVSGYTLAGSQLALSYSSQGCARQLRWTPLRTSNSMMNATAACSSKQGAEPASAASGVPAQAPASLQTRAGSARALLHGHTLSLYRGGTLARRVTLASTQPALALVADGGRLLVLRDATQTPDRPARLEVYSPVGVLVHDWPLLARPSTLAASGGTALFSVSHGGGLFALRLADGRTTFLGPERPGDRPQIDASGVAFQSDMYKKLRRRGAVELKFLPQRTLRSDFARTFANVDLRWPITSVSMDGPRVAFALNAPAGTCDQVRYWNIPWHYLSRITMADDYTCSNGPGMTIHQVALAGITAEWVATGNGIAKVISSDSTACIERVIASPRSARGTLLAGDRRLLGFSLPFASSSSVVEMRVLAGDRHGFTLLARSPAAVVALSASQGKLAALGSDGRVRISDSMGRPLAVFTLAAPRAIGLRGSQLVALTGPRTLQVVNATSGKVEHSWTVPAGTRPSVDAYYGVAVFGDAKHVYALNLATGKLAVIASTPAPSGVQIESPGAVYSYNLAGHGHLRFVPFSRIEELVR